MKIRIATRGSKLALWQAEHVQDRIKELHPECQCELVIIKTKGDIILDVTLSKVGGKGLFVKEIEDALLQNEADIAVHSMKDVPSELPEGLGIYAILEREDPRDAFVSNKYANIAAMPKDSILGTSSLRRSSQAAAQFGLQSEPLRGNVQTRLRKLDEGQFDAILLAAAGLKRLELSDRITEAIDETEFIPACGQGAVGIECADNRPDLIELLGKLAHPETSLAVSAERIFNDKIGGSCQVPAGCHVRKIDSEYLIEAFVASPDGQTVFRETRITKDASEINTICAEIAEIILAAGADKVLQECLGKDI